MNEVTQKMLSKGAIAELPKEEADQGYILLEPVFSQTKGWSHEASDKLKEPQ